MAATKKKATKSPAHPKLVRPSSSRRSTTSVPPHHRSKGAGTPSTMETHRRGVAILSRQLELLGFKKIAGHWTGDASVLDDDFSFISAGRAETFTRVGTVPIDFKARIFGQLVDWKVYAIMADGVHTSIGRWFGYNGDYVREQQRGVGLLPLVQTAPKVGVTREYLRMKEQGVFSPDNMQGLWIERDLFAELKPHIDRLRHQQAKRGVR